MIRIYVSFDWLLRCSLLLLNISAFFLFEIVLRKTFITVAKQVKINMFQVYEVTTGLRDIVTKMGAYTTDIIYNKTYVKYVNFLSARCGEYTTACPKAKPQFFFLFF